jgi:hypothetical protein
MTSTFITALKARYRALTAEGYDARHAFELVTSHNDLPKRGKAALRRAIITEDSQGLGLFDAIRTPHPLDRSATDNRKARSQTPQSRPIFEVVEHPDVLAWVERQKVTEIVTSTSESDKNCHPVEITRD